MSRYSREGSCERCQAAFRYFLVDNVFNGSAYAYCERCGSTAVLRASCEEIPGEVDLAARGPIEPSAEAHLAPCPCGGRFRGNASPRCPSCRAELSADAARVWIEANAPKARKDWSWQSSWRGVYCIVIENRIVTDGWSG